MLVVDCQSHVFPRVYAEVLTRNRGELRTVRTGDAYRVEYGGVQQFTLDPEAYDPVRTLHHMDAVGLDVSVLSANMPGPERLSPELVLEGGALKVMFFP